MMIAKRSLRSSSIRVFDRMMTDPRPSRYALRAPDRPRMIPPVLDHRQRRVDHFAQIVRRNVRGHPDSDAARTVDQHVRKPRGQDGRLAVLAVIVVLKIDRVLFDVREQRRGGLVHPHFRVAHRRRVIAVHRPEVALTVQKRQRHREILRHPHQRVIDRAIAMRVVFAHHVADRARRFPVGLVMRIPGLVHRIQDAPVHRFQPVAQVGNGARNDH
jgi:hypothetical protein